MFQKVVFKKVFCLSLLNYVAFSTTYPLKNQTCLVTLSFHSALDSQSVQGVSPTHVEIHVPILPPPLTTFQPAYQQPSVTGFLPVLLLTPGYSHRATHANQPLPTYQAPTTQKYPTCLLTTLYPIYP